MTRYRVIITPEAQRHISAAFDYIAARAPMNAQKWIRGLHKQIDKLELFPRRCGDAREQPYFEEELRQLVYKSHRIIYTINDDARAVIVVEVRHAKRRTLGDSSEEE